MASRYTGWVTPGAKSLQEKSGDARNARILAIDYGRARIGLAVTSAATGIPEPLDTLERINRNEDMRRLRELIRDLGVKRAVVGLPLRLDGTRGEMAEEAERFAARLAKQAGVSIEMMDERLTSWQAEQLLQEEFGRVPLTSQRHPDKRDKAAKTAKLSVDSVAATVILREYLERNPGSGSGR